MNIEITTADIASTLVDCDMAEANGTLTHLSAGQNAALIDARVRLMAGDVAASTAARNILGEEIDVPLYAYDRLRGKFDGLVSKAEARGYPVPVLQEVSRTDTHVRVKLTGAAPVHNGWSLVAVIDCTGEHHVTRPIDGSDMPEIDDPTYCDACQTRRKRSTTFVVRNDGGDVRLLGSTCVDDYVKGDALKAWLAWRNISDEVITGGAGGFDPEAHARYLAASRRVRATRPIPAREFFAAALAAGPDVYGPELWDALQVGEHAPADASHMERADRAVVAIAAVDSAGNFHARCLAATRLDEVGEREAWIAARAPHYGEELIRLSERGDPGHVDGAEVGERIVLDVRVASVRPFSGGQMYAVTAVTGDDERDVVWYAPARRMTHPEGGEIGVGDDLRVLGTVKRLGEWRGVSQTVLSNQVVYAAGSTDRALGLAMRRWSERRGVPCPRWAWTKAMERSRRE